MIRITDIVLLAAAVGGAVWTYQIKHDAEQSAKHLGILRAQIAAQDRKISLREADWAIETGPARLAKIAKQHKGQLQLRPMESSQIIDTSELPGFRVDRNEDGEEIYAGKDGETVTGGINGLLKREGN